MKFREIFHKQNYFRKFWDELSDGNIAQFNFSKTAVVLLDENLLPPTLDALSAIERVNITMGFPLKNLGFSNAMKKEAVSSSKATSQAKLILLL
ncbi:hypothetical protein [Halpernia sp. GG3]